MGDEHHLLTDWCIQKMSKCWDMKLGSGLGCLKLLVKNIGALVLATHSRTAGG